MQHGGSENTDFLKDEGGNWYLVDSRSLYLALVRVLNFVVLSGPLASKYGW